MNITCKYCGSDFLKRAAKKSTNEFCSRACSNTFRNKQRSRGFLTRTCRVCSNEFHCRKSKPKHHCSKTCYEARGPQEKEMALFPAEYGSWKAMRGRVRSKASYKHLDIDPRWESFATFITDLGPHQGERKSLDRKDNAQGYWPSNCRWATAKEQGRNRRTNRILKWKGEEKPLSEWAEFLGMSRLTLKARLDRGWTVEHAFTVAIAANGNRTCLTFRGRTDTIAGWARRFKMPVTLLRARIAAGQSLLKAAKTPVRSRRRNLIHLGKTQSFADWGREMGVASGTIRARLRNGWSVKAALETPLLRRRP